MKANEFTIANIAGGDEKTFRLVAGRITKAAVEHARAIGFGGPLFAGPAAQKAVRLYEAEIERRLDNDQY